MRRLRLGHVVPAAFLILADALRRGLGQEEARGFYAFPGGKLIDFRDCLWGGDGWDGFATSFAAGTFGNRGKGDGAACDWAYCDDDRPGARDAGLFGEDLL